MAEPTLFHPRLKGLYSQLRIQLDGETDFSPAGVALYTSDASNYRQIPLGVVFPKTEADIELTLSLCSTHQVPVLMRGAGTSQNGQTVNEAVILDCSRFMNNVLSIDVENRSALVQPGIVCDSLKAQAQSHGLTFGPDPATHSRCTLGGMIGNNSCGPHSMLAGKTVENVLELEVLTSDGTRFWAGPTSDKKLHEIIKGNGRQAQIYRELKSIRDDYADEIRARYPTIKRRVSGYNLDQLLPENGFNVARALVGTEGTCVSVLKARVALIENPNHKRLFVLGFKDIFTAGDIVPRVMPYSPIAMEGLDWNIIGGLNDRNLRQREVALLPEGKAWLLIELADVTVSELNKRCTDFEEAMRCDETVESVISVTEPSEITDIWSIREQGASATALALNPGDTNPVVGWEDTAVDPMQLGDYLRELYALVERYGYTTSLYGHFGDGCIHARMTFDTRTAEGVEKWRRFSHDIAHLVVKYNGSLSGEHGDGQAKAEFLPIMFGDNLMQAFRRFKHAWDPDVRMNPGKLIDAYRMDENLRLGPQYSTPVYHSTLHFAEDVGHFGRTTERCIGMGKCRASSGSMCPSYQVTGEERFSTRGRAHLLHELLRGEVIPDGFADTDIAESLEHCLSCKACKTECPTHVDIAAFKAEFMAQHYKTRRRALSHHLFGKIGRWLPMMSRYPAVFNGLQTGIVGRLTKSALGVDKNQVLPKLATEPFSRWINANATSSDSVFLRYGAENQPPVVLWVDSTSNAYRPHILRTTVELLSRCGFNVLIAKQKFCCGRPLYEHGFLHEAKAQLLSILIDFLPELPKDASVVVLEPSCLSVFKDELHRMYPLDARARELSQRTMTITQFLRNSEMTPERTFSSGILHLHCHAKSDAESAERYWMQQCFDKLIEPENGCCGMAGTFGILKKTSEIGKRLFARNLQEAVRISDPETIIVSDGFSCHKQFKDHSDDRQHHNRVLHPVEVLDSCM